MDVEIDRKAELSAEKYRELQETFTKGLNLLVKETVHTVRYVPGDVRLRKAGDAFEFICKEKTPSDSVRKRASIGLTEEQFSQMPDMLGLMGFSPLNRWTKHKEEYAYKEGRVVLSLQHIEDFAYLLEAKLTGEGDAAILDETLDEFGCEPVDPEEFTEKTKAYIEKTRL